MQLKAEEMTTTVRNLQVRGESFAVITGFYDYFWSQVEEGNWESATFDSLATLITDETVFVDIGAWIGPITLFAAQRARFCIGIEPDPKAFEELRMNVAQNRQTSCPIDLIRAALWNGDSGTEVALRPLGFVGDSMSSIVRQRTRPGGANEFTAKVLNITELLSKISARQPKDVVVKMDIEGGEYEILAQLAAAMASLPVKVHLLVSLHPQLLKTRVPVRLFKRFLQGVQTLQLCRKLSNLGPIHTTRGSRYRSWQQFLRWMVCGRMEMDILLAFPPQELVAR